jgi:two-component system sensor histidine kinase PilS (NtrC family)
VSISKQPASVSELSAARALPSGWFSAIFTSSPLRDRSETTQDEITQRPLRLFLLYRITLSLALMLAFYTGSGPEFLGQREPQLYGPIATLYAGLALLSAIFWRWRSPNTEQQAYLILTTDIAAISLLMHTSGGIESGLGILVVVSITGGALMLSGRAALLFAALGTLAMFAEQIYSGVHHGVPPRFPQAGLLGAAFFASALLTLVLSDRVRKTEKLAHERKKELGNLARLNEYIIQHMQTGVLAVDGDNRIILMNDPAWHLLDMPDAPTGSQLQAASPELHEMLLQWRNTRQGECPPFRCRPQGSEIKPHIKPMGLGGLGGVLLFLEDTSNLQREAQQMKLASLGRLTASIAHEIRNPLGAISHASQLFDESPELNPADRRLTQIIKTNSARVNQVIENVLQLSRRKQGTPEWIALAHWFEELIDELIKTQGFSPAMLYLQITPAQTGVFADQEQLRQVVINICNNAREHTADRNNLRINLIGGKMSEFNYPVVDIVDNGPGIAPDVARQIFEPFFTTRNQGTGLGLFIAKELCEANQIRLEYIPGPTGGSCFRLHFQSRQPL